MPKEKKKYFGEGTISSRSGELLQGEAMAYSREQAMAIIKAKFCKLLGLDPRRVFFNFTNVYEVKEQRPPQQLALSDFVHYPCREFTGKRFTRAR